MAETAQLVGGGAFTGFLFVCMVSNLAFLVVSARDAWKGTVSTINSLLLISLATANLAWILPCFVQCLITVVSDYADEWWNVSTATGCDLMASYSVFASVAGLLLVTEIAYVSWLRATGRGDTSFRAAVAVIVLSFLVPTIMTILPLAGVGKYSNTNEGFCYLDFSYAESTVPLMILIGLCLAAATYFFAVVAVQEKNGNGVRRFAPAEASDGDAPAGMAWWYWIIFAVSFFTAWIMWLPGGVIGLTAGDGVTYPDMFPSGFMIIAGTLAHFQSFINPILYGYFWRRWVRCSVYNMVKERVELMGKSGNVPESV